MTEFLAIGCQPFCFIHWIISLRLILILSEGRITFYSLEKEREWRKEEEVATVVSNATVVIELPQALVKEKLKGLLFELFILP